MERFHAILANIWREACRHIEIEQSAASFAKMLDQHLPLGQIIFWRFEQDHRRLLTVALAPERNGRHAAAPPTQTCSEGEWRQLLAWTTDNGAICHGSSQSMPVALKCLVGEERRADFLAAPLRVGGAPVGLVQLIAKSRHRFHDK